MPEKRIIFNSGELEIEGLYNQVPGNKGIVVTHPHPLHGGDMMNMLFVPNDSRLDITLAFNPVSAAITVGRSRSAANISAIKLSGKAKSNPQLAGTSAPNNAPMMALICQATQMVKAAPK